MRNALFASTICLLSTCVACAGGGAHYASQGKGHLYAKPQIVAAKKYLQCVPYARSQSGVNIKGDAWTWWQKSKGKYARGRDPSAGAVIVIESGRRRGHLAVVARVLNEREIVVNHANWLNRGRVHMDTPVVDVSPRNDWSQVRVWYTPGDQYGTSIYAAKGFIYPNDDVLRVSSNAMQSARSHL